jgi:hypothetical protein
MYQAYIQPYTTRTMMGEYLYPPPTAVVEPGNPIGGAFTLPTGFINVTRTYSLTPKTAWPGYTTVVYEDYYNGPGKFQPNHGSTASNVRVVFPTTGGNPTPNYGLGNPLTPTTTFDGRYDMSRGGSIHVTPGPRRFGGTFRLFYGPNAGSYQYIYYFSPVLYKRYGYYFCLDDGIFDCTPNTHVSEVGTTAIYSANWFLLTENGKAKATTPTTPYGSDRTPYGNASFIAGPRRYLNLIHPWTTGFASVQNPIGSPNIITPQAQGYDTSLGGADITVTHYDWNANWNSKLSTITTTTVTTKQYLYGVGRIVSMVRPRLIHTYKWPDAGAFEPISTTWQAVRLWRLKVFFVPEPTGLLPLGTGLGLLVVLHRVRRRG